MDGWRTWAMRDVSAAVYHATRSQFCLLYTSVTVLYAFLTIQVDGSSILDFLRRAACFLFLRQQYYEWRQDL